MDTSRLITRRTALIAGLASVGGMLLPGSLKKLPPTYGNILRMGDNLTYAAHRLFLPKQSLVREYRHEDIAIPGGTGLSLPGSFCPDVGEGSEVRNQLERR